MSNLRVSHLNNVTVDARRERQTPRQPNVFHEALKGGARVLLSGAAAATRAVGMPEFSAAISRVSLDEPTSLTSGVENSQDTLDLADQAHRQRVDDDLKLLALQSQIQRHNRQVTLVSNVMKARHDTAKSAIGNMRS